MKFVLGFFCLLGSDQASDFVEFSNKAYVKVDEQTFNKVFQPCHDVVRGLCLSSNSENRKSDIQVGKIHFQQQECHAIFDD